MFTVCTYTNIKLKLFKTIILYCKNKKTTTLLKNKEWSRFALEPKDKAFSEQIKFEDCYVKIRK